MEQRKVVEAAVEVPVAAGTEAMAVTVAVMAAAGEAKERMEDRLEVEESKSYQEDTALSFCHANKQENLVHI